MNWKKITDDTVFPGKNCCFADKRNNGQWHYAYFNMVYADDFSKYIKVNYTHWCEITPPESENVEIAFAGDPKTTRPFYAPDSEDKEEARQRRILDEMEVDEDNLSPTYKLIRKHFDSIKKPTWEEKFRWETAARCVVKLMEWNKDHQERAAEVSVHMADILISELKKGK